MSTYILSNVEPETNISLAPAGGVVGKQYTLIRSEQPKNALSLIETTLWGMVMLGRLEQKRYLQPVINQHFASNKSEIWS